MVRLAETLGQAFVDALPPTDEVTSRRFADHYLGAHDPARALPLLTHIGEHERAAQVITAGGPEVVSAGAGEELIRSVDAMPEELRSAAVLMTYAHAHQVAGDNDAALACYRKLAVDLNSQLEPGLAWRMGLVHYLRGEPGEALEAYRRGRLVSEDTVDEAQLLAWMSAATWLRGDAEESRALAHRAHAAATACGDDSALAAAHVALAMHAGLVGARRELNEHYDRAYAHAQRAGDRLQVVRVCTNRGSHLIDEGQLGRALADLEVARTTAAHGGFLAFEALCEVNTGQASLHLGRIEEAARAYDRALTLYQQLGSRKSGYALVGIGEVHLLRGAGNLAHAAFREALEVAGEDVQTLVPALLGMAGVQAASDPEGAVELARRASEVPGPGQARSQVTLGWLVHGSEPRRAADLAARGADLAERSRDWVTLAQSQELGAVVSSGETRRGLIHQADLAWRQSGSLLGGLVLDFARTELIGAAQAVRSRSMEARFALERLGVDLASGTWLLRALPRDLTVGRVEMRLLGVFEVLRDGVPVEGPLAQSRKARELLKVLLARAGPVPRGKAAAPDLRAVLSGTAHGVLEDEPYAIWAQPLREEMRGVLGRCRQQLHDLTGWESPGSEPVTRS